MSDFVVRTKFTASDQVSAILEKQAKAAEGFGSRLKGAFDQAAKQSSVFRSVLAANLASKAISTGFRLLNQGARSVVGEFVQFDDAITSAAAKMPGTIRRGSDAFAQLQATARRVGAETKYSATEAAEGLNFLAMAGFDADQAMATLPGITKLATAAGLDLARATDIASDALGAFGLMSGDTATLTGNLARINDVFAMTTNTANVDLENLFESMKNAGPVFTSAGQSVETFAAMAGKMGSAGIKGGEAGTALRNAMLQLTKPAPAAQRALKNLGIEVAGTDGNMRDILSILGDYNRATEGMGGVQRDATTELIFGRRAIAGVNVLLAEGEESLKDYRSQLEKSGGTAADIAGEMEGSLGNRLLALRSAAIETGFRILDAFAGDGRKGIEAVIEAVRNFDVEPLVKAVTKIAKGFRALFGFLYTNRRTIKNIALAFIAIKATMGAINFARAIKGFMQVATAARTAAAAGGAPGVAGATAGGGMGAMGKVGAVGAAAAVGYGIGSIIEDTWLNPLREAGQKTEVELANLVARLSMKDVSQMEMPELQANMNKINSASRNAAPAIHSLESAFEQFTSFLSGEKGPLQKRMEQAIILARIQRELAAAMENATARISAAGASMHIDQTINAPAGTTVTTKGSPAPTVNQNAAGKA